MSTLKELRTRIKAIQSTQKITSAMKMVAVAKLRKAQDRLDHMRKFARHSELIVRRIMSQADDSISLPLLSGGNEEGKSLLIVMGSDRGLCGAYNGNIIKQAENFACTLREKNEECIFFGLGKKIEQTFRTKKDKRDLYSFEFEEELNEFDKIKSFSHHVKESVDVGYIKNVYLITGQFKNRLSQPVLIRKLVPFTMQFSSLHKEEVNDYVLLEPGYQKLMPIILEQNLTAQIYLSFLENYTCEQAARMAAMENATKNAHDMISELQLTYNQTRQAYITRELIEIISAAQAL